MSFIIAGIIIVVIIWIIFFYNRIIKHSNLIEEAWSDIDIQLKRRHDLVPNLVTTVQGYAMHEQETLKKVAELRNILNNTEKQKIDLHMESELSRGLKSVFALSEQYPELKADKNFLYLQKNLIEIEDAIQYSRRYYNGTVRDYSIVLESFPNNIINILFKFSKKEYFTIEYSTIRNNPSVDFDRNTKK
ncbi:LemA family protein [Candidatus Dependentiae bacterium]|nr:LemA family protein [Candidatus Dependentiae bacterium]